MNRFAPGDLLVLGAALVLAQMAVAVENKDQPSGPLKARTFQLEYGAWMPAIISTRKHA